MAPRRKGKASAMILRIPILQTKTRKKKTGQKASATGVLLHFVKAATGATDHVNVAPGVHTPALEVILVEPVVNISKSQLEVEAKQEWYQGVQRSALPRRRQTYYAVVYYRPLPPFNKTLHSPHPQLGCCAVDRPRSQ